MATAKDISGNSDYVDATNVATSLIDPNTALLTTISSQLTEELTVNNMTEILTSIEDVNSSTKRTNRHLKEITEEEFRNDTDI